MEESGESELGSSCPVGELAPVSEGRVGFLPYEDRGDERLYFLRIIDGVILSDYSAEEWCELLLEGYELTPSWDRPQLPPLRVGNETEILIPVSGHFADCGAVVLTSSQLLGLLHQRCPDGYDTVAIDVRLYSLLLGGIGGSSSLFG